VAGVILAAGASRRMGAGRNKMLLQLEGESLLRRAARRAVAAGLSPVVVVLGHEADRARAELKGLSCESVVNSDFTGPTSGSLHKGLEQLGSDVLAAVVMLGDMVLVTEQMLSGLVAAARGTEAPLVVSRYGDVTAPPLLFRRALFGELLAWSGEGCGKAVVQAHRAEAVYVDWPGAALTDVDTPEDFATAQTLLARAHGRRYAGRLRDRADAAGAVLTEWLIRLRRVRSPSRSFDTEVAAGISQRAVVPGRRASHSSSDRGQSSCNRRDRARSASTRPPV